MFCRPPNWLEAELRAAVDSGDDERFAALMTTDLARMVRYSEFTDGEFVRSALLHLARRFASSQEHEDEAFRNLGRQLRDMALQGVQRFDARQRPPGRITPRARRESRGRPVRRRGSRRVTASRAGPGDDPEGEPEPPGLRLWRHELYGPVNPAMYRALLAVGR